MTKMPTQFKYEKKIWFLSGVALVLVFAYLGFVGRTVFNTLERQRSEKEISKLTGELSEMEFAYLNVKAGINPELARSLGFVEVENVVVAKTSENPTAFVSKDRI